jgi:hypothetical protein
LSDVGKIWRLFRSATSIKKTVVFYSNVSILLIRMCIIMSVAFCKGYLKNVQFFKVHLQTHTHSRR